MGKLKEVSGVFSQRLTGHPLLILNQFLKSLINRLSENVISNENKTQRKLCVNQKQSINKSGKG